MAEQVSSKHDGANEIIGALREAATGIKALGDEIERVENDRDEALDRLEDMRREADGARSTLAEWTELLHDFRSGIRDRDELLDGTIGRR